MSTWHRRRRRARLHHVRSTRHRYFDPETILRTSIFSMPAGCAARCLRHDLQPRTPGTGISFRRRGRAGPCDPSGRRVPASAPVTSGTATVPTAIFSPVDSFPRSRVPPSLAFSIRRATSGIFVIASTTSPAEPFLAVLPSPSALVSPVAADSGSASGSPADRSTAASPEQLDLRAFAESRRRFRCAQSGPVPGAMSSPSNRDVDSAVAGLRLRGRTTARACPPRQHGSRRRNASLDERLADGLRAAQAEDARSTLRPRQDPCIP